MPVCKYYQEGSCHFSDDKCWYRHIKQDKEMLSFKCGICKMTFNSKSEFMSHRKIQHNSQVKTCINHKNGKCEFFQKCWYNHEDETSIMSHLSDY